MKDIEQEFVGFFKDVGRGFGMPQLPMHVVGQLYMEPEPVAMEDIAKATGYSLASISNTMKMLEGSGVVQRSKKPGTKKVYFFMEKNLAMLNIRKLNAAMEIQIKPAKLKLPVLIKKYKNKAKDDVAKQKLKIVEDYLRQMLIFEKLIKKWRKELEELSTKT